MRWCAMFLAPAESLREMWLVNVRGTYQIRRPRRKFPRRLENDARPDLWHAKECLDTKG